MGLPRAVQRKAHKNPMFLQKLSPFLIQQRPIGLYRIVYGLSWLTKLLYPPHKPAVELESRQRRFAALKGKSDMPVRLTQALRDQRFGRLLRHLSIRGSLPLLHLICIETVPASKIAAAGRWLDQYI